MTSLNPSHIPSRSGNPSHGQAVHGLSPEDHDRYDELNRSISKRERHRPKRPTPVIPDLRFEQSYLVSIRPFLRPKAGSAGSSHVSSGGSTSSVRASHLSAPGGGSDSKNLVTSAQNDEIFSHGREIEVDWKMASWVTLRDQLFSPLAQGVMWGFLTIAMGTLSSGLHVALYPKSHVASGRVTGGPRGKIGGGEVVGGTAKGGYWRGFVKSIFGGLETAAV